MLAMLIAMAGQSHAAEPIQIGREDTALDLTRATDIYTGRGDVFQVSTAPDAEGIVRTIEVQALQPETAGNWAVFILRNATGEQIDRLLVAPHYRLVGSGLWTPDLGSQRIVNVTPSEGFSLERVEDADNDIFAMTLNPGAVVTFVVELSSPALPQLYLWDGDDYERIVNSYTLYHGIVLGIAGLLALFLTVIFMVRGTSTFPAAAALSWAALAYICVDFGFVDQFFDIEAGEKPFLRAASEGALAATLLLFLFNYLRLNRWSRRMRYGSIVWLLASAGLALVILRDPPLAAGISRLGIAVTAVAGVFIIGFLVAFRRFDRAIMLIPSWVLLIGFVIAAWLTVSGRVDNDIIQPALAGAGVLIVLMIGFTVMQNAFSGGSIQQNLFSNSELQALAVQGSDSIIWNWDIMRDRLITDPDLSVALGMDRGQLQGPPRSWIKYMHTDDRDRFRTTLDSVLDKRRGRIALDLRMRMASNHYAWYRLRARPVVGADGSVIRCIGTMSDVDDQKRSEERMMRDAVHDNLTGLPNRELFLDRVRTSSALASTEGGKPPTVFIVDLDRFKQINETIGIAAGDTLLISMTRRLLRMLQPHDTLARIGGDQFGIILLSETEPSRIAEIAETLRKVVKAPITFAEREIVITPSIGLATWTTARSGGNDLFADAELALFQAKRYGGDRVEPFRPAFRSFESNRLHLEADLGRAIEREEISLAYQPILEAGTRRIVGFEALMRWSHPRRGDIPASEFITIAERSNLINDLGRYAIDSALRQLTEWGVSLNTTPVFVAVNVSPLQLRERDFAHDVTQLVARHAPRTHSLKLEITESAVMANPEQAIHTLERIRDAGVELALDDFGTGYSSLSYLARFPFNTLKIDQSFMRMAPDVRTALLRSMIDMAHTLGLNVVAEGAETDADVEALEALSCDMIQGYVFGKPLDADAAGDLLREHDAANAMRAAAQ